VGGGGGGPAPPQTHPTPCFIEKILTIALETQVIEEKFHRKVLNLT
jgi:hypothetical protein